jgi:AbrB family looped-hinge helix DNA binding protein
MASAKLTTKGRVTIPASVRAELKLKAGDRVEFVKIAERRYEIVACNLSIMDLEGIIHRPMGETGRTPDSFKPKEGLNGAP